MFVLLVAVVLILCASLHVVHDLFLEKHKVNNYFFLLYGGGKVFAFTILKFSFYFVIVHVASLLGNTKNYVVHT